MSEPRSEAHTGDAALICAVHTLGFRNARRLSLAERCRAAAEGGFRRIGWAVEEYVAERAAGRSDADIRAIPASHGIEIAEIEVLSGWGVPGTERAFPGTHSAFAHWHDRLHALLRLTELVHPRHMVCVPGDHAGSILPLAQLGDRFAEICDRAAPYGLRVVLEFMPWSAINDLESAWAVVRAADRPNGGISLDVWHFFRGKVPFEQLARVPAERIHLIQMSDALSPQGTLLEDTIHRRRFPGEGGFPLVPLMAALAAHGVDAPVSVEVIADDLLAHPPQDVARKALETTRALLARVPYPLRDGSMGNRR